MTVNRLLVANRGEIAVRVVRSARRLGIETVAICPADDADGAPPRLADRFETLEGRGVTAYLDIDQVVSAAQRSEATSVHPGYGFLAERADFAEAVTDAGLTFVGPRAEHLRLFGDKLAARAAATAAGVAVLAGSVGPCDIATARKLLADHGAIMLKAVAGGGGRGMRPVTGPDQLDEAWERAASEARAAFGLDALYVEQLVPAARHVEVQLVGDSHGGLVHLGERDCSVQRRNQKLIEIAPAPALHPGLRDRIHEAALALGNSVGYQSLGTVEFLVDAEHAHTADAPFWFIETNARIQVEHTVTEAVTGVDLVETQLRVADGASLADLGLSDPAEANGFAVQCRINAERIGADGNVTPSGGPITRFDLAGGPGVRVDTALSAGSVVSPLYDSLLAKLIVHTPAGFDEAIAHTSAALAECRIEGPDTTLPLLGALLRQGLPYDRNEVTTTWLANRLAEVVPTIESEARGGGTAPSGGAGARIDNDDPLAVLAYAHGNAATSARADRGATETDEPGTASVRTPLQGTVVSIEVGTGQSVRAGQLIAVVEAMKMEHEVRSPASGSVRRLDAAAGDTLWEGERLLVIDVDDQVDGETTTDEVVDLDEIRPQLAEVLELRTQMMDDARPDAVARRHDDGKRTARENVTDLVDDGTFVEWGPMALAAQRRRRSRDDLIARSPADGLITGVGSINGEHFGAPDNRCAVMVYDYTVFAGTQGIRNHAKTDKIIDVALEGRMPFVLFAEGGGGRPGDTDGGDFGSRTFSRFATMSGLIPMVGVVSGRCFAGNASLLGCCDVIIATRDTNLGMGGPAMIEGGGLGVFRPEEIGPVEVQRANGVIDVVVEDEAEATAIAKKYLSYFQGRVTDWEAPDQRLLRHIVPENRLRTYDVRRIIDTVADVDSVLELKPDFGHGMVTSLVRIEGRPLGLIANNPNHLGGAIDSDGADKAARFMQLCDAFDVPLVFLCDTPGIMVGPEIEKTALVRHSSRMFLVGANLEVPTMCVVIRKAYGLGGIAMAGGSFKVPVFSVAWPSAEFGPMGLEGSVKLGFRAELAAIEDPEERKARFDELVAKEYRRGGALNYATAFAVDDTIDPAETRRWLANTLASLRPAAPRTEKKRPWVDGW